MRMASVSTGPPHGNPTGVGTGHPVEGAIASVGDTGSRHGNGIMHPAPSLFEAPPTGSPRPEDPRSGQHGVRAPSASGQSPRRGSGTSPFFEGYTPNHGAGRRPLGQRNSTSPPMRHDTISSTSTSTNATSTTIPNLTTAETASTPYSTASSPTNLPSQVVFPINEGSEGGSNKKPSRRRTGPLSAESRERAGMIRKVGACYECRRRRVACHPSHRGLTWEEAKKKYGNGSGGLRDIAPVSPSQGFRPVNVSYADDHDGMDIDRSSTSPQSEQQPTRTRKPLPTGPRLEKTAQAALSLPPIDTIRSESQNVQTRTVSVSSRGRYDTVEVLLLLWADECVEEVEHTIGELRDVLSGQYNFACQIDRIPPSSDSSSSWRWLSDTMHRFTEQCNQRGALKIVYYNGHSHLTQDRDMVLSNSTNPGQACEIRWRGIQSILEEAVADTLVIMDSPYFGSAVSKRQGVLEVLAGGSFEDYIGNPLARCEFTKALTGHLRRRAGQTFRRPLTVADLHAELSFDYPKILRDWRQEEETIKKFPSPLHLQVSSSNTIPSILLAPLVSITNSSPNMAQVSRLNITVEIAGIGSSMEPFLEWARLMPLGVRDVTIQGPFRAIS